MRRKYIKYFTGIEAMYDVEVELKKVGYCYKCPIGSSISSKFKRNCKISIIHH